MLAFFLVFIEVLIAFFTSISIDLSVKNSDLRSHVQRGLLGSLILAISLTLWFFH